MNNDINPFIGQGWAFPPSFETVNYSVVMVSGEEDIQQSLRVLFSTVPGERIMVPGYGCDLRPFIFENIDNTLINRMKLVIEKAVLYYESRINLEKVDIEQDPSVPGLILITLEYIISETNTRTNMVYPFYTLEGTDVDFRP